MSQPPQPAPEHIIAALQTEVVNLRKIREALEGDNLYLRATAEHHRAERDAAIIKNMELESRLLAQDSKE